MERDGETALARAAEQPVQMALVYREGEAGSRHLDGILQALRDRTTEPPPPAVVLFACPYTDEDDGKAVLRRVLGAETFHAIIGPTDSGVYSDAAGDRERLRALHTPIVSALVTAPIPNRHDGWLFRTNVGVESRAGALYDHLDESGFDQIAVIYSNTTFGRAAEAAFRRAVEAGPAKRYEAMPFESPDDLRVARRKLDEERPGAVGIFATRDQIDLIRGGIRGVQSGWNAYTPLLFTIVDARTTGFEDLHFVSLVDGVAATSEDPAVRGQGEDPVAHDEVYGLGYDTASMLLRFIGEAGSPTDREVWQKALRRRLASWIQQSPTGVRGRMTGMHLRGRENVAKPAVLTLKDDRVQIAPIHGELSRAWRWVASLDIRTAQRADILQRRYGYAPGIALAIVLLISGGLSISELRSWHGGRSRSVFLELPFVGLIVFNMLTAATLFVFLATTDYLRWDSLTAAVLVGLGYTALLNSTVFKTAAGEKYGVETIYKRVLGWLHDRVMVAKYHRENAVIKFIAYTNTCETLERMLRNIFRFARTQERRDELIREMQEGLQKCEANEMEQRIFLARELKSHWRWARLQDRRFVPADVSEREMVDPDRIVSHCALYCLRAYGDQALSRIKAKVEEVLAEIESEHEAGGESLHRSELKRDLDLTDTRQQRLEAYLRWLFIQYAFKLEPIKATGFAPDDLQWDNLRVGRLERILRWLGRKWRRLLRAVRLLLQEARGPSG